jgi:hypothetical protein
MSRITFTSLLFLLLFCTTRSKAQVIAGGEYFINTDPGVGNGIPIIEAVGIGSIDVNFNISTNVLPVGFNQLFIRLKDQNNNWGIAEQRTFYIDNTLNSIAPSLTAAEYFLDTDPGVGNGIAFAIQNVDSVSTVININTAGLSNGFHQLFIRTKEQNNTWGIAEQRTFYINNTLNTIAPSLTAAEYFLDTDPGVGNGSALNITTDNTLSTVFNITTTGLAAGFHQLFIRVKDQTNNWSIAEQRTFLIDGTLNGLTPIIAAEYYVDTDLGIGNNTPVAIIKGDPVNASFNYNAPNLALGQHTMNLRVEDSVGNWSLVATRPFTVCATYGPLSNFQFTVLDSTFTFINNSQYGTTYQWNFGDGVTSALTSPIHTYKRGTYNVCLISKNSCRPNGDTLCQTIVVGNSLPVTLVDFTPDCISNKVVLTWHTATESNSSFFEIQKSMDAINWSSIGQLVAVGNSTNVKSYQFTDEQGGAAFYRLRLVDKDGSYTYSPVIKSNCASSTAQLQAYPIPAKGELNVYIQSNKNSNAVIQLIDMYGKTVMQLSKNLLVGGNTALINVTNLSAGTYFLKVQTAEFIKTEKIIVEH